MKKSKVLRCSVTIWR